MINKVKTSLKKVDKILHIADVHIRNWKRHKEYKLVFDKLFEAAKQLPEDSIITIGGDIVHAKTDMSPELIHMVSYLFNNLADIRPTIVICGNHDTNLNNNNRLDALTPIIEAHGHPNLFYLRDSGAHKVGNTIINIMSLLDDPKEYKTADTLLGKADTLIAMYHGTIANSKVDSGLNIAHGLDWDTFAGHDIVLLGDIHKRQILSQAEPLIFYPGSTVQQNFGESYEGHGYAIVDVPTRTVEHFDIQNDYGYYTLEIRQGVVPDNLSITSKTSVRAKVYETTPAQLKKALAEIRKKYKNGEVLVTNMDKTQAQNGLNIDDTLHGLDVRNVDYQTTLLKEYLDQFHLEDELTTKIVNINKGFNSAIVSGELVRNVVWTPKKFEFDNMFSYGEGNSIAFENLNGICGLFAPNHAGKSATLDALCFCLFDHSFRASKAEQVLNRKKDSFWCLFNFELNGLDYYIEKKAARYQKGPLAGKLRVDIDFWYIDHEGQKHSLNGEQRKDTNKIIQSYVGSFDDFILTALSLQGNNSNFIEKTQGERKDLLANFLDLKIFDNLCELASKEIRTTSVLLEEYEKQDFEQALGDAQRSLEINEQLYDDKFAEYERVQEMVQDLNEEIIRLSEQIKPTEADGLDLALLEKQHAFLKSEIESKHQDLQTAQDKIKAVEVEIARLEDEFNKTDVGAIQSNYADYCVALNHKTELDAKLQHYKVTISTKLDKLKNLEEHEYDPNCKYCVENVFVKDAIKTKQELEEDKKQVAEFLNVRKKTEEWIERYKDIVEQYKYFDGIATEKQRLTNGLSVLDSKRESIESQIQTYKTKLDGVESNIKTYNDNLATIEANRVLNESIKELRSEATNTKSIADATNREVQNIHGKVKVSEKTITECEKNMTHMQELSEKQVAYDYYIKAVCRDGIPYSLISKAIPYIQSYVNNILAQVTDFTVEIETDGKNINVYIAYDDNKWPLELASGMERFVSSLAIRVALIKITNLPKPNFIAIDEGLGVLDSNNLNSMHMFFNYLKDTFKFSLIISHIDVVRDMVDTILTIDRKDDLSYIKC
jgi:DNA repair exonuclease SbcCD ATPase subunit/DNA repair exonuclease SbcCD nuclease subunit